MFQGVVHMFQGVVHMFLALKHKMQRTEESFIRHSAHISK